MHGTTTILLDANPLIHALNWMKGPNSWFFCCGIMTYFKDSSSFHLNLVGFANGIPYKTWISFSLFSASSFCDKTHLISRKGIEK